MKKSEILLIDDDKDYCKMISEYLSDEFICHTCSSGPEGIELLKARNPCVVLVDLGLPGMDGFEVCEHIRGLQDTKFFSIFVVSGSNDLETKLKSFESGADDFIGKPYELKELRSRINRSIQFVETRKESINKVAQTKVIAEASMKQASQYSFVMNFFKSLNHCGNQSGVVHLFFDAMKYFGFSATIMIRLPDDQYFDANHSEVSPIEKNIYKLLCEKGRLYEFGSRLMVNDKHVSFLIKNMPHDSDERGQARDFLAALIEGVESKLVDIEFQEGVSFAVDDLKNTILEIKKDILDHNSLVSSVVTNMQTQISASYHALDMNEEQEVFFTRLVEDGANKMSGSDVILENAQIKLEELVAQMEDMQNRRASQNREEVAQSEDVELF